MNFTVEEIYNFDTPFDTPKHQQDLHFDDPIGDELFDVPKESCMPPSQATPTRAAVMFLNFSAEDCVQPSPATDVDFYKRPTALSRMILFQKYASANKRCRDHPEEAPVWMFSKRTAEKNSESGSCYALRQLPIHIAARSLDFAYDPILREELERLIVRLVVTYPLGCSECDHSGNLPLHYAIQNHASSATIAVLLMAAPSSIAMRDSRGHLPADLNAQRIVLADINYNRNEVQRMLTLGQNIWEEARQEAKYHLNHASHTPTTGSVASTSVLAASQRELDSMTTDCTANMDSTPPPQGPVRIESEDIQSTSWEQLEKRTVFLEQILSEVHEQDFELTNLVDELRSSRQQLLERELERLAALKGYSTQQLTVVGSDETHLKAVSSSNEIGADGETDTSVSNLHDISTVRIKLQDQRHSIDKDKLDSVKVQVMESCQQFSKERRKMSRHGRLSELSSLTSDHLRRHLGSNGSSLVRSDSVVSELTEASFYDGTVDAVLHFNEVSGQTKGIPKFQHARQVPDMLGTDNLQEMFEKAASKSGESGNSGINLVDRIPTATRAEIWSQPFIIASPVKKSPLMKSRVARKKVAYNQQPSGSNNYCSFPPPAADVISPSITDIVVTPSTDIVLADHPHREFVPPTATAEIIAAKKLIALEVTSLNTRNLLFIFNPSTHQKREVPTGAPHGKKQMKPHGKDISFSWAEPSTKIERSIMSSLAKEIILPGMVTPDVVGPAGVKATDKCHSNEIRLPGFDPTTNAPIPLFSPIAVETIMTDDQKEIKCYPLASAEKAKPSSGPNENVLTGFGADATPSADWKEVSSSRPSELTLAGVGAIEEPSGTSRCSKDMEICLPGFSPIFETSDGAGSRQCCGSDRVFQTPCDEQSKEFLSFMNGMVFGNCNRGAKDDLHLPQIDAATVTAESVLEIVEV